MVSQEIRRKTSRLRGRRRERHMLLTYGVAALKGMPQPERYELSVLYEILGNEKKWKVTQDAMVVVARTFSGATIDGTMSFQDLYPHIHDPTNFFKHKGAFWIAEYAVKMVYAWWRHMCTNNKEIALKTDLLSFLLFGSEFHLSKFYDQKLKDNHKTFFILEDRMIARFEKCRYSVEATLLHGSTPQITSFLHSSGHDNELDREYNIWFGKHNITFSYYSNDDEEQQLRLENPDTVTSALELSLSICEQISQKVEIVRLQPPKLLDERNLLSLHSGYVKRFRRHAYVRTGGEFANVRQALHKSINEKMIENDFVVF